MFMSFHLGKLLSETMELLIPSCAVYVSVTCTNTKNKRDKTTPTYCPHPGVSGYTPIPGHTPQCRGAYPPISGHTPRFLGMPRYQGMPRYRGIPPDNNIHHNNTTNSTTHSSNVTQYAQKSGKLVLLV
jgi:hypothetical protein